MGKYFFLLIIIFVFSCKNENKRNQIKSKINQKKVNVKNQDGPFYDFDEVEYYSILKKYEFEAEISMRKETSERTKSEQNLINIYLLNYPKTIEEVNIIELIKKFYKKKYLSRKKYPEIKNIYSQKFHGEFGLYACAPFYRDILVFKNKNKVVGISKICFQCYINYTIGTKKNTEQLGQNGDYEKLIKLLKH